MRSSAGFLTLVTTVGAFNARLTAGVLGSRCCAPQLRGADIPDVVLGKARLALATKRKVGDEDEMRILWQTFKKVRVGVSQEAGWQHRVGVEAATSQASTRPPWPGPQPPHRTLALSLPVCPLHFRQCYPNEQMAIEAAEKNSAVFNPQLNSPTKITGTFALLCKRFGKKGAQELIMRNPGVLVCSPASLDKESNESILNAASLIETLDANKPLLRVVARTTGTLLILSIIYGIIAKNAGPDADIGQLIFNRYFGTYLQ